MEQKYTTIMTEWEIRFFSLYRIQLNYTGRTVAVIVVGVGEKATEDVCV